MKILLTDDHAIVRQSLEYIINAEFPGTLCVPARDASTCVDWLKKERFELLILDMNLPDMDGLTLTEWILDRYPLQRILFFSTSPMAIYAKKLYQMGIMGYVNKQSPVAEIVKALHTVLMLHEQYLDEEFKSLLALEFLNKNSINPLEKLSNRELSIAQLMAHGKSFEEIAMQLHVESSTIRTYKSLNFQQILPEH
jgi:two-component system invasion response regulator UvrY